MTLLKNMTPFPILDEHDACAIIASANRSGKATHGNVKRILEALSKMGHRSGDVNGEGDGCGVLTDIPRRLWADTLEELGKPAWLAEDRRFFVGHLMVPVDVAGDPKSVRNKIRDIVAASGADLLVVRPGHTRQLALGRLARKQEPIFWQIAGLMGNCPLEEVERRLFDVTMEIEKSTYIHVASLSSHSVVYKVRGAVETLYHYYPELRSPQYTSAITLGHARYSTNTATAFERVQPFSLLGHNGEINTIARLRQQAQMLGVQLVQGGSDSQDLDRLLSALIHKYGLSLIEAIEVVFPPILSEVCKLPPGLQSIYRYYRHAFGPFSQGPAAIVARYGDECVFSVDALGLRPLWFGGTEKEYFFSSEKGVVPLDLMSRDPRPLSPGEKMSLRISRTEGAQVLDYPAMQERLLKLSYLHLGSFKEVEDILQPPKRKRVFHIPEAWQTGQAGELTRWLAAFGWGRDDQQWVKALAQTGHEPIGSLGYDGPLAALSEERQNVADYFKESVAVVTNPAIDRERETEQFSTQCIIGPRPDLDSFGPNTPARLALDCPILLGGEPDEPLVPDALYSQICAGAGTMRLEDVIASFDESAILWLPTVNRKGERVMSALERLVKTATHAVRDGVRLIVLDDASAFMDDSGWIDPHLVIAVIDGALRADNHSSSTSEEVNARRRTGLIIRSGAMRNLHDLIMALGLGADAVAPYMMFTFGVEAMGQQEPEERAERLSNILEALRIGLEKVISTMGIHELRGYGPIFSSIGLGKPIAEAMGIVNFAGSDSRGLTWTDLDEDAERRAALVSADRLPKLSRVRRFYPRVWQAAGKVSRGEVDGGFFEQQVESKLAKAQPVSLRHVLGFRFPEPERRPETAEVDAGLTGHDLPFVIASMSFGSQGETAFRAYAEAAGRLNMIALNGEGGEIPDLMGKYPYNRGQQIASGRFGVDVDLINSSNLLEIKIGQGAKPGEGGHLPGRKVSHKVAGARHTQPGVDLISPSNNHDIYSIEDLAQFIEELKTTNPKARVAVKVPVVPGIGTITVGIVKAGADIVNLTGYDGGTGAARVHSTKFVGLPAEIGIVEAHKALCRAGLRKRAELWCDGGMRTAADVVKMICLGANRVGFGTMAMVAIGCVICRSCHTDTCHVGIATQIESVEEAQECGLNRFEPQKFDLAVQGLVQFFGALGESVREITSRLGFDCTQDLVGRSDLLQQVTHQSRLDLDDLLTPAAQSPVHRPGIQPLQLGGRPLRRPRNHLTTLISNLVMETALVGEEMISFEDDKVSPVDRALGTHLSGALTRYRNKWMWLPGHGGVGGSQESWRPPVNGSNGDGNHVQEANLRFYASSVPGNGLGAYSTYPLNITIEGGAQDGVGKGMHGGKVVILKGYNHDGTPVDGSVGKGLAYGAIGGLIVVQGNADSRACVRLSGADVIIGGTIRQPLNDSLGLIGVRANVKGFLCEYMTGGRVLVLGDPGPWICSGMTGGILYLRLQPQVNFDRDAIRRRIARGARVDLLDTNGIDEKNLCDLLTAYADELQRGHQSKVAEQVLDLLRDWRESFVKVVPVHQHMNQTISTE